MKSVCHSLGMKGHSKWSLDLTFYNFKSCCAKLLLFKFPLIPLIIQSQKSWSGIICLCYWSSILFLILKIIWFFIFGCVGSSLLCVGFFPVVATGDHSSLSCMGFSLWWLPLLQSTGSRCLGFNICSTRAQLLQCVHPRTRGLQWLRRAGSVVAACRF